MTDAILYCADPHGQFCHIIDAAGRTQASAVVLLGDMASQRPLHIERALLLVREIPLWFIRGNHDADSDDSWRNVWGNALADRNVHGCVVVLPKGQRLAGPDGVIRGQIWHPTSGAPRGSEPAFRSTQEHGKSTPPQEKWEAGPQRRHWASIYPAEADQLADQRADVLTAHEALGYHRNGFELPDTLAQSMGAKVAVHGHHHERIDSSSRWATQGSQSYGVGLRGVASIAENGNSEVVVLGELDEARAYRGLARS